jgi:Trk-type K+ transport system membrane component
MTDWFSFLILDLGNSVIGSIPAGVRVVDGLFQATAVRAAGFAIVSLSALAPAVKYVVMSTVVPSQLTSLQGCSMLS